MVQRREGRLSFVPVLLLSAGLLLTAAAAWYAARANAEQDRLRFENAAERVRGAIENRLDAYIAMLLGGAGLFAGSATVDWQEFRSYVDRLQLPRRYPGIQGIGFSRVVAPEERESVAAQVRPHVPTFEFWPNRPGETVHAIMFLEPQDPRNRVALGYDMFSEERRRAAMERARDSATPAATARVVLVQELSQPYEPQAGFLIYVPVYRGGSIPATEDERRSQLLGFVYSPFRAGDLLRGIESTSEANGVNIELFDGTPSSDTLLYRSAQRTDGRRFETSRMVDVAGRTWVVVLWTGAEYAEASGRLIVRLVAAAGVVLSLLLFAFTSTQIRARRLAERTSEELRRSEDALREANRAKDEFLAMVSHELRTPLNAIVGWASMLRRGQVPPDNQAHALEVIERNAVAQTRLVEDLLDISRAVAGRLSLQLDEVDVASTLRATVDALRPDAASQGVELACELAPDLGSIRADASRLEQIALNLLSNGIKFTPRGGRVELRASRTTTDLTVVVSDTGIGIPSDFLPYVFERFRQADASSTRSRGGVGLGLAIARHLVELHGGTIEAASDGLHGTAITVRLPATADPRGRATSHAARIVAGDRG